MAGRWQNKDRRVKAAKKRISRDPYPKKQAPKPKKDK